MGTLQIAPNTGNPVRVEFQNKNFFTRDKVADLASFDLSWQVRLFLSFRRIN
jgi:hypothetical protein